MHVIHEAFSPKTTVTNKYKEILLFISIRGDYFYHIQFLHTLYMRIYQQLNLILGQTVLIN